MLMIHSLLGQPKAILSNLIALTAIKAIYEKNI